MFSVYTKLLSDNKMDIGKKSRLLDHFFFKRILSQVYCIKDIK